VSLAHERVQVFEGLAASCIKLNSGRRVVDCRRPGNNSIFIRYCSSGFVPGFSSSIRLRTVVGISTKVNHSRLELSFICLTMNTHDDIFATEPSDSGSRSKYSSKNLTRDQLRFFSGVRSIFELVVVGSAFRSVVDEVDVVVLILVFLEFYCLEYGLLLVELGVASFRCLKELLDFLIINFLFLLF